nr:ion channel [uncultured Pseudomonas sp.]
MTELHVDDSFWRDADQDKRDLEGLGAALHKRAQSGVPMRGFQLKRAQLAGIDLVNHNQRSGFDLRGSSLMKADLRGANLHCCDLRDCNLLGVQLDGARLDNVIWDRRLRQERQGHAYQRLGDSNAARRCFEEAEETYRNLRLHLEKAGLFDQAGIFFHREMVTRRLQLPRYSGRRLLSWVVDLFSGYGEKPLNVVLFSIVLIIICGLLYFLVGVQFAGQTLGLALERGWLANLDDLTDCLYFSVVTFTTLGYGDITPQGLARPIAAFEAFTGSFTMALFVVVFVKKMTR